jgi:hypothetical protein
VISSSLEITPTIPHIENPFVIQKYFKNNYKIHLDFTIFCFNNEKNNVLFFSLELLFVIVLDLVHEFPETADGVDNIITRTPYLNLVLDGKIVNVVAPSLGCDTDEIMPLTPNQQANLVLKPKGHVNVILDDLRVELGGRIPTMDRLPHHLPLGYLFVILPIVARILLDNLCHCHCIDCCSVDQSK